MKVEEGRWKEREGIGGRRGNEKKLKRKENEEEEGWEMKEEHGRGRRKTKHFTKIYRGHRSKK